MLVLSCIFKGAQCHLLICGHQFCIRDTEMLCLPSVLHVCKTGNCSFSAIFICQNYCTHSTCKCSFRPELSQHYEGHRHGLVWQEWERQVWGTVWGCKTSGELQNRLSPHTFFSSKFAGMVGVSPAATYVQTPQLSSGGWLMAQQFCILAAGAHSFTPKWMRAPKSFPQML